jgi:hypothetical protein
MDRYEIIQKALNACGGPDYVEIGVYEGETFSNVTARRKHAVDPDFRYDWASVKKENEEFFVMTSDEYFGNHADKIDGVVYVDGYHSYEQALRDIENALSIASNRSIILVDDVSPSSPQEARKLRDGEEAGSWSGDVWKAIVHLRTTRPDLKIKTMLKSPGLSYIIISEPDSMLDVNLAELAEAGYEYLEGNREVLLNGKSE